VVALDGVAIWRQPNPFHGAPIADHCRRLLAIGVVGLALCPINFLPEVM
jgi:hypothetical protein